jgi:ferric-dicitrate binding protein FerR (iron transport regulator)
MSECQTWASLSDRAAVGDTLTVQERLLLRSHPHGCAECGPEQRVWDVLEGALERPELLTSAAVDGTLAVRSRSSKRRSNWVRYASVVAAVAAAAAVAVGANQWFPSRGAPAAVSSNLGSLPQPAVASRRPDSFGGQVALAAGVILINQRAASAGQRLTVGDMLTVSKGEACISLPPGVTVCLDETTDLTVETLDGGTRRVRLHRGHAVAKLEPQPAGSTFGFETEAGSVIAKGTVFSLRSDGAAVALRVHEGTVLKQQRGETSAYKAPVSALFNGSDAADVADRMAPDSRLAELASYFTDGATGFLAVTAAEDSQVLLGDMQLGTAPISAMVQPGDYRLEVSRQGHAPIVERLNVESGSRVARNYEATAAPPLSKASQATKNSRAADPSATAAGLLEKARSLRAEGRYRDAGSTLQRLLREHAGSAEARVALVSLGELQLSQLGDAQGALRTFDAYLRGGGRLRQEASYGRIRALRQLGRAVEAREASESFVLAYPNSAQASKLRSELRQP